MKCMYNICSRELINAPTINQTLSKRSQLYFFEKETVKKFLTQIIYGFYFYRKKTINIGDVKNARNLKRRKGERIIVLILQKAKFYLLRQPPTPKQTRVPEKKCLSLVYSSYSYRVPEQKTYSHSRRGCQSRRRVCFLLWHPRLLWQAPNFKTMHQRIGTIIRSR